MYCREDGIDYHQAPPHECAAIIFSCETFFDDTVVVIYCPQVSSFGREAMISEREEAANELEAFAEDGAASFNGE